MKNLHLAFESWFHAAVRGGGGQDCCAPSPGQRHGPKFHASPVEKPTPHESGNCEQCGEAFTSDRKHVAHHPHMARKRFCSERCRKAAESKRRRNREGVEAPLPASNGNAARDRDNNSIKEAKSC